MYLQKNKLLQKGQRSVCLQHKKKTKKKQPKLQNIRGDTQTPTIQGVTHAFLKFYRRD